MKVVHIVNLDILGGAAKAASALNKALIGIGVDSTLLVQNKFGKDEHVSSISYNFVEKLKTTVRIILDIVQMKTFTKIKKGRFSFGNIGIDISKNKLIQEADIIHLHWINQGYLSIKSLLKLVKLRKPIVWTLHDMWAFTGGCHYNSGCKNYFESCGHCPYLIFASRKDFSKNIFIAKKKLYEKLNINFITCSEWLASIAAQAPLIKDKTVQPIHNTLDINIYKPMDQNDVRKMYNLPEDKFLILFVSLSISEERKGFVYLKNSLLHILQKYPSLSSQIEILILGKSSSEQFQEIPFKINQAGRIKDDREVAQYYNAANVFLAPSLEDNLPNTVLESLSCGTPVVAFKVGGIPEMVEHKGNGYLAEVRSFEDFANGIYWMFQNRNQLNDMRLNARNKIVEQFNPQLIANTHLSFYKRQLKNR